MTRRSIILTLLWTVFAIISAALIMLPIVHQRERLTDNLNAVAEDLGCTFIEQSYQNPNNFYIDCGDDDIRILKVE